MSEEQKYIKVDEKTRTIETSIGDRFVFSNKAFGDLGCRAEELERGIHNEEEFQKFRKVVFLSGQYKIQVKEDGRGPYKYVYIRGESQQLKVVPMESLEEKEKRLSPIRAGNIRTARLAGNEAEIEDAENTDLANNLFGSVSKRKTNNKDTREIDLNAIMHQTRDLRKETKRQIDEETQKDSE